MDEYRVLALLAFLFPLAYSPGPGNMFFAAIGARFGLRSTLAATAGYHITTSALKGVAPRHLREFDVCVLSATTGL